MNAKHFTVAALAAGLLAAPALAQTTAPSAPVSPAPAAVPASPAPAAVKAADRNPALTDSAAERASKIVGAAVYNDRDEKIGSVDDVLIGKDGKADSAVLSVGGFLGAGSKLVTVPYGQLKFGNAKAGSEHRIMLTGATKDSLKAMADYHYATRG